MLIYYFFLCGGGVTNILTTELFTQTTRPAAYIIAGSVNWFSFFFIGLVFPFIVVGLRTDSYYLHLHYPFKWVGLTGICILFSQIGLQQYCFLVFLAICCLVVIYIFLVVPETKNKSFLEIHNEFQSSSKRKVINADGAGTTLLSTSIWNVTRDLGQAFFTVCFTIFISQRWVIDTRIYCTHSQHNTKQHVDHHYVALYEWYYI